jgi:hypothetical protein
VPLRLLQPLLVGRNYLRQDSDSVYADTWMNKNTGNGGALFSRNSPSQSVGLYSVCSSAHGRARRAALILDDTVQPRGGNGLVGWARPSRLSRQAQRDARNIASMVYAFLRRVRFTDKFVSSIGQGHDARSAFGGSVPLATLPEEPRVGGNPWE